jgi:hypothetical protein
MDNHRLADLDLDIGDIVFSQKLPTLGDHGNAIFTR